MFFMCLLNNIGKLLNLILKLRLNMLRLLILLLLSLQTSLNSIDFLLRHSIIVMLISQSLILSLYFVLQLWNLVRSNLELSLQLSHLILSLNQVLRVQISIRSDSLIQVLLLLEFTLKFNVFLFELTDQIFLEFDFFNHLHEICVGFWSFMWEFISFFFKFATWLLHALK